DPSNKRRETGVILAQMFNYASKLQKPLTIICLTDGGMGITRQNGVVVVDNNTGRIAHPGDNDSMSLAFCLTYQPSANSRSDIVRSKPANARQIGYFSRAGVVRSSA